MEQARLCLRVFAVPNLRPCVLESGGDGTKRLKGGGKASGASKHLIAVQLADLFKTRTPGLSVPEVRRSKGGTTYLRNAVRGEAFAPRRSLPLASSGAGGVFAVGPRPGHVHSVPQVGIVACLPSSCCSAAQRVTITRLLVAGCFALCHAKDASVPVLCQVVYKYAAH